MTLTDIAAAYRRHLPPGELLAFRVDALDHLGVPVVTARLIQDDGTTLEGIGYGASTEEAMVGALGELSEEAHCELALKAMPRTQGSYDELVDAYGGRGVVDPLTLCLPAGSDYTSDRPLSWVRASRVSSGEAVFVPEEFAADSPRQLQCAAPLATPITNGLGAGLSFEQALVHGLLELLQRDGNVLSYRALDRGIAIDIDTATLHDGAVVELLARYRAEGIDVTAKVAATDFGMLNVVVVGGEARPGGELPLRLSACGEAVHPDRERALRKALLEFAGSRCRKSFRHGPLERIAPLVPPGYLDRIVAGIDPAAEEPRALRAMVDWLGADDERLRGLLAPVLAVRSRVALGALPTVPSGSADAPAARLAIVAARLADAGLDVLAMDFSPPGGTVFALKAIVPGLESETLSYHRIGERGVRRLLEQGSGWTVIGAPRPGMRRVALTTAAEERLGGPAWLDTAAVDAAVGALYPLYREPGGHAAQIFMNSRK